MLHVSWYCVNIWGSTYRVIQEESAILWEMIVCVILSKKVHTNMGPILNGYGVMGIFLIPVHALMWTALTELAEGWWLTVCIASINFASWLAHPVQFSYLDTLGIAQFTTERQPVLRPAVAFPKTSFKHRSVQIRDNFTMLTLHLYFNCIMYYVGLFYCSVYCQ